MGALLPILRDLFEYTTLALITLFDVPQAHGQSAKSFSAVKPPVSMIRRHKWITYVVLVKLCMPKLAVPTFKETDGVFVDGTVEAVLSVCALLISAKPRVQVSSLVQVWQRCAAMEDRNELFLEYRQGDRTAE